jgi:hypothetical protein
MHKLVWLIDTPLGQEGRYQDGSIELFESGHSLTVRRGGPQLIDLTIQPVTEVQRLTWEQYLAGEPCRGCGRPMEDATLWSGSGKGLIHLSEEERVQYDSEEQHFKVRHADCNAHRWTVGGSLTTHCGKCCPPPPMSPDQTARIATLLHHALRDQQGLKVRK